MIRLLSGCALAALVLPTAAFAQSTGSQEVEDQEQEIVVTGTRDTNGVEGFIIPDVPKTRSILGQEIINRQVAGQSILQTINLIPGVNYTNSDPYGGSGGNLRIRGFPGNRIALLWDGLPLNDTGNYAIFGNQQFDPELIDQVSVNLGTTDVDSPTPSSAGGVVSYRTRLPTRERSFIGQYSRGTFDYNRVFGSVDSGELSPSGLRGFVSASAVRYDKFKGPGDIDKTQYNGRVYQPLGTTGDFVSISGHFNRNRNNFYNNGLLTDIAANRDFDNIDFCARDLGTRGVRDNDGAATAANSSIAGQTPASCTNFFELRINPSNTGNIRGQGRFTLTDKLLLTVDPGYQYVLANGGGTTVIQENDPRLIGRSTAAGVDLNRDGDILDRNVGNGAGANAGGVRLYTPNTTRTNRYTALVSLIYEVTEQHRLRVAYSYDRGEHRQTGEFGYIEDTGIPFDVFGGKRDLEARVLTADGLPLQGRDRESVALLNQISGEYFGQFLEDRFKVQLGIRAPFFERQLDQRCFTIIANGNASCTNGVAPAAPALVVDPAAPRPAAGFAAGSVFAPFERTVKYSPILPSAGASFEFVDNQTIYASYGRNFSAPSTDNLYRSVNIDVSPETTNAYELGYRFRSGQIQAQIAGFYTDYKNRIVTATDQDPLSPTFGSTLDRNVGDAEASGIDGSVAYQPIPQLSLYAFGAYLDTELKNNVPSGAAGTPGILTAGAQFVETPKWSFGGRVQGNLGPLSVGAQFKHVGKRFATDDNGATQTDATRALPFLDSRGRIGSYNVLDLDARVSLAPLGLEESYLSLVVTNVTDEFYFGNINTTSTLAQGPRFSVGAPRTYQATVRFGF